ncbi:MAG: response regulator [Crocinitomicaceae bacterium]|nr:response regulator [Crocinitomicaceae bacterium]
MEKYINILLFDQNHNDLESLYSILRGRGHNIFKTNHVSDFMEKFENYEIGIVIINLESPELENYDITEFLNKQLQNRQTFLLVLADDVESVDLVKGYNLGAVDYLKKPFNEKLVKTKIEVFKKLYFKEKRIIQLLENILPKKTLEEFYNKGVSSPKRIENGSILFTDFKDFSKIASENKPIELIKKLDYYFSKYDEIVEMFHLEKIKTIGDAYMAVGGVTESNPNPSIRTALAAIRIRDIMETEIQTAKAFGRDFWEVRIGMHTGELIAGVIGKHKFTFDVWGHSVNVASRCEKNSEPQKITVSKHVYEELKDYFEFTERGTIDVKNIGELELYFLDKIKEEFSLYREGKIANQKMRQLCGLPIMDFNGAKTSIINTLKSELSSKLIYHNVHHTLNVEKAAVRLATLEGIDEEGIILLRTAVLFHDTGFIYKYDNNEELAVKLAEQTLPYYGYTTEHIEIIKKIILATANGVKPQSKLEMIICDADHDYLGRPDYNKIAKDLREEMRRHGKLFTDFEWYNFQLNYLQEKHEYYTTTAYNLRQKGKENKILEIQKTLKNLT